MDTCQYIVQWSAKDKTCGAPATVYLPDVTAKRQVPLCEEHAAYSRPLKDWP